MKPTFPVITINQWGYLDLFQNEDHFTHFAVLAIIKEYPQKIRTYDKSGLWQIESFEPEQEITGFAKFLARTFSNPVINGTPSWKKNRDLKLDDLKKDIKEQVENDSGLITGFYEKDVINNAIYQCKSFDEIVQILNKYVFQVNEEEYWRKKR